MLRHYDAIGLLLPAHVDRSSGYRFYEAAQLSRLNRIVALKGLGFTLQQVQTILDEDISTEELRGMLRLRRAELQAALADAASGLAQIEARLRSIEIETPDEGDHGIVVHVGLPVPAGVIEDADLQIVSLPPVECAATIVHRGMTHGFLSTSQLLVRWVDAHGYWFDGHAREVTLNFSENAEDSVAELQAPVVTV
jgi:DNA-binding transcriptional MerR regulator